MGQTSTEDKGWEYPFQKYESPQGDPRWDVAIIYEGGCVYDRGWQDRHDLSDGKTEGDLIVGMIIVVSVYTGSRRACLGPRVHKSKVTGRISIKEPTGHRLL